MPDMLQNLAQFLLHWAITALALWLASLLFKGLKFTDLSSLVNPETVAELQGKLTG